MILAAVTLHAGPDESLNDACISEPTLKFVVASNIMWTGGTINN